MPQKIIIVNHKKNKEGKSYYVQSRDWPTRELLTTNRFAYWIFYVFGCLGAKDLEDVRSPQLEKTPIVQAFSLIQDIRYHSFAMFPRQFLLVFPFQKIVHVLC